VSLTLFAGTMHCELSCLLSSSQASQVGLQKVSTMTTNLDRTKLAKVCGLLSSDHSGERASAAARADAMVRSAQLTWDEVIAPPVPAPRTPPWSLIISRCQARPGRLYPNEVGFLDQMKRLIEAGGEPTERQASWLRKIYVRRRLHR
jgi:hypothetical protein